MGANANGTIEIDHNFSRAHRIVTTSVLPIVEQYAKHSEAVWEGSKFWKQFFEASANVSLEGYDDAQVEDSNLTPEETDHEVPENSQAYGSETLDDGDETITEKLDDVTSDNEDILSSPSMAHAHSTPRMPATGKGQGNSKQTTSAPPPQPTFAEYPSPYEALKREMEGEPTISAAATGGAANPATPGKGHALPDMSMTPGSSPFVLDRPTGGPGTAQRNKDTILHQGILNKTYRVAATPHRAAVAAAARNRTATAAAGPDRTPATATKTRGSRWLDDDTLSSPPEPTPQLRADLFSPVRPPRTPGASVLTPGLKKRFALAAREREAKTGAAPDAEDGRRRAGDEPTSEFTRSLRAHWESDDEVDELMGMSPPKTIQFELPRRPVLQTPGESPPLNAPSAVTVAGRANGLQRARPAGGSWRTCCSRLAQTSRRRWRTIVPASSRGTGNSMRRFDLFMQWTIKRAYTMPTDFPFLEPNSELYPHHSLTPAR